MPEYLCIACAAVHCAASHQTHELLRLCCCCCCCHCLQATDVLRGSAAGLSAERKQYLEELRTQLNLSKETGDKILR